MRFYHAGIARFLQRDLVRQDTNPYTYVRNDPPHWVDSTGLQYEWHHIIPEWFAHYSSYGARAQGLRMLLEQGVHRGPGTGIECGLTHIRNLMQSGAISQFVAYNRILLHQLANLPRMIGSSRRAAAATGGGSVAFAGGARAALAQLGYLSYGQAAMAAAGVGLVAGGAAFTYWAVTDILENQAYAQEMESDLEFWNKYIDLGQKIGRQHAQAAAEQVTSLLGCPDECSEQVQECLDDFGNLVANKYGILQAAQYSQALQGVSLRQARMVAMERAVSRLISCLEGKGGCKPKSPVPLPAYCR